MPRTGQVETPKPAVIAHADWGSKPRKRQMAVASLADNGYQVTRLAPATESKDGRSVLDHLLAEGGGGTILLGVDFPIGLPKAYASRVGLTSFLEIFELMKHDDWASFSDPARALAEVNLRRPFYPGGVGKGSNRAKYEEQLEFSRPELRRVCDGNDAESVFWTMGAKQVGRGALSGWQLIGGALDRELPVSIWPFHGSLPELLSKPGLVLAETYPREYYEHFLFNGQNAGIWSKRRQTDRLRWIDSLLSKASEIEVDWEPAVLARVRAGFDPGNNGEDEFDAVIGLLAIARILAGGMTTGEPSNQDLLLLEGWILGRDHEQFDGLW